MEDAEGTFRITDRRRHRDRETGEPASTASPTAELGSGSGQQRAAASAQERAAASAYERAAPRPAGTGTLVPVFLMLGHAASAALGLAPDPTSGERRTDLRVASATIDLLIALRDKTQGRLDDEESRALADILYDLQLRYVEVSRRAG
ncbi:MAG TPA: DUF1844 domain-containing protein [Candidatus Tectomicrobia bacterium]|nr:DUF1844 domain-containing protein [Candidatus Tectomicrobia bacterium]